MIRLSRTRFGGPTLLLVALATRGLAEEAPPRRTVVAGAEYAGKAGLHHFFLGRDYRELWAAPFSAEVLDLQKEAGGLTPVRRVGGLQTKGLALRDKNGRSFTFRGVEKDASHILEEDLRGTVAQRILQDLMAAQHPASEVIARRLLEAAGIPCPAWRLVVMPDDPALGEFRKDFAGAVGVFAEYPTPVAATHPGFLGATEIIDHLELYKRLEAGEGDAVDARALLKARLADVFMGDWDRHRKQWRWAKIPGQPSWEPIPEDRDQAFSRYEGAALDAARRRDPRFQNFRKKYDGIGGLTYNGWEQDRRLLAGLTQPDFEAAAQALRSAFTNEVIEGAAHAMPPEWFAIDGARLIADLEARRDDLPRIAVAYYRHLAGRADVYLTNQPERVDAVRAPNGDLTVTVARVGADGGLARPYYERTFKHDETQEVRLYALGGDDTVKVTGASGGVKVRVIGGLGNDRLDAAGAGNAKLSDSAGNNHAEGAALDTHPYKPPPPPRNAPWIPPRDWTRETWTMPWLAYSGDLGAFVGAGVETQRFGFRKDPNASDQIFRAGYSFGEKDVRLDYKGLFRRENRSSSFGLAAYYSGAEVLRFYGFGNESPNRGDEDFYRVSANQGALYPAFVARLAPRVFATLGPLLKYTSTDNDEKELVNIVKPYGVGQFGELGIYGVLSLDTRDKPVFPRRGVRFSLRSALIPGAWDVQSTFGLVSGDVTTFLSAGRRFTLALRGGGKKLWGDYPFFEAATIGGGALDNGPIQEPPDTVRGFRSRRFMGDGSLYGNAEGRLRISHMTIVLPGDWGAFGFVDTGRVFKQGEDSNTWHTGAGGGLWLTWLNDRIGLSAAVAHSTEDDLFYLKGGFSF